VGGGHACGEWTKKTPTAREVSAELNPHNPMATSAAGAPRARPVRAPMAEPLRVCAARAGEYQAIAAINPAPVAA